MLRKNTIIESMALPMNAPVWAGLGMMKPKIKMRRSSVDSHLGMRLDCPPHASGARPCAGVVAEGFSWREGVAMSALPGGWLVHTEQVDVDPTAQKV